MRTLRVGVVVCVVISMLLSGVSHAWLPNPVLMATDEIPVKDAEGGQRDENETLSKKDWLILSATSFVTGFFILIQSIKNGMDVREERVLIGEASPDRAWIDTDMGGDDVDRIEVRWEGDKLRTYAVKKRHNMGITIGLALTFAGICGLAYFVGE